MTHSLILFLAPLLACTDQARQLQLESIDTVARHALSSRSRADRTGADVALVGDQDGDDQAELLIGAPFSDDQAGTVYLVAGGTHGRAAIGLAHATLHGVEAGDGAGGSVAAAGDTDGDGWDEVLVGAAEAEGTGALYLLAGPLSGSLSLDEADGVALGLEVGDLLGSSVGSAGDVDGDGLAELLVGAPGVDDSAADAGAVYLLDGPLSGELDLSEATAVLTGVGSSDGVGGTAGYAHSVLDSAGDLDGDGLGDIVIGGPLADVSATDGGTAWLFYGPISGELSMAEADGRWSSSSSAAYAGWSVAGVGDLDADGLDDLLVGAPGEDDWRGSAYLVLGPASGGHGLDEAESQLTGRLSGDTLGFAVDRAGDLNGDGTVELAVGIPGWSDGSYTGAVALVDGDISGSVELMDVALVTRGESAGDYLGWSLAGDQDTDGDGAPDLLLGAPAVGDDSPRTGRPGTAWLMLGAER